MNENEQTDNDMNNSPEGLVKIFVEAIKSALKPNPLLLGAGNAAKFVGVGKTLWYQLNSEAKIPAPIRLNKRVLWRRDELHEWTDSGCPLRNEWENRNTNS